MNKQKFPLYVLLLVSCFAFGQAPTGLSGTDYRTTVHLKWDGYTAFQPVGYNIYRSTVSNSFGAPARRIGAYTDYTDYGLTASTTYYYKIAAFDGSGNESALSNQITVSTNNNNYQKVSSLDLLIPIYTGNMAADEASQIRESLEFGRLFYFRNSKGQLNLNFHFWEIPETAPVNQEGYVDFGTLETDLRAKGIFNDQYDAIQVSAYNTTCWCGGLWWFGQTAGSMFHTGHPSGPIDHYVEGDAWVFVHEFGHSLDFVMANGSGHGDLMLFNHPAEAFPLPTGIDKFDAGPGYDNMAEILRLYPYHLAYSEPWGGYFEVVDSDGDGLANNDNRLPFDETDFGTNPNIADADNDGLNDLKEFYAANFSGSNPHVADTDGDGQNDGSDPYPISNFNPICHKTMATVAINGILNPTEGWQPMASTPFFSKSPGTTLNTYTTWDDNYLYFAFQSNQPLKYYLSMDGSGEDGCFASNIRFPGGNYSGGYFEDTWGDTYFETAAFIIRSDASQIIFKDAPMAGSQVSTSNAGGIYTTEVRIPHNIGPGFGWTYTPPNSTVANPQDFIEGDVLGIELHAMPLANANGNDREDWRGGNYIMLNHPFHLYDMTLTGGSPTTYCASTSNFPWEDWIAKVKLGTINNPSGKSTYSDFTSLSTNLSTGSTPIELTTGFSYFTWDEYWRVWVDLNHDGDFTDAGETVFEGIKTKPANGTSTVTLMGNINIPTSTMTGATRMRVTMKRGAYALPCETLAFGEVEDYTVNISSGPAQLPNLGITAVEIIGGGTSYCFTNPSGNFGSAGGVVLNTGMAMASSFTLKGYFSKDQQFGAGDVLWNSLQYPNLAPGNAAGFGFSTIPVPASLPPGLYYILFIADQENTVAESNESDNLYVSGQLYIGAPDFTVSAVTGVPATIVVGNSLNLAIQAKNISAFPLSEATGNMTAGIHLSADNQFNISDDLHLNSVAIPFTSFSNPPNYLNGTAWVTVDMTIPGNTAPGNYFLFVALNGASCEQSVANNLYTAIPIQIMGGAPGTYCASYSNFPWEDWIAKVKLGTISNASGKSMYSDFTSISTSLNTGPTVIELTTGFSYFTWDEYWRVWIDLNHDGDFTDAGETVFEGIKTKPANGTATTTLNGNINLPTSAMTGATRMRVSMKRGAYATPCETLPFGEVEDYSVNINGGGGGCSVTAVTSNILCQDNGTPLYPLDDGFTFSVLVSGTNTGSQWQMTWSGGSATGTYGTAKTIGPLLIATFQNGFNFNISDTGNSNCTTTGSVTPPPPCSTPPPSTCGFSKTYAEGNAYNGIYAEQTVNGFKVIGAKPQSPTGTAFITLNTNQDGIATGSFLEGISSPQSNLPVWLLDGNYAFLSIAPTNLVKLEKKTANGAVIWSNTYSIPDIATLYSVDYVFETPNGDLIVTGSLDKTTSLGVVAELLVLKVNSSGVQQWLTTTPANPWSFGSKVFEVSATGDIVIGIWIPYDQTKFVAKVSSNGTMLWKQMVGSVYNQLYYATEGTDGNVLVGTTQLPGGGPGNANAIYTKLAALDGSILWTKSGSQLGGTTQIQFPTYIDSYCTSTTNGGYAVAFLYNEGLVITGVNADGSIAWTKKHDASTQANTMLRFFKKTADGGYLLTGLLNNQLWLMKTDGQGNLCATPPQTDYCASTSNFPWEDWIGRVKLGTLDNTSGKSTYSNFTALSTNLQKGQSYTVTLTTGYSYFTWDEYWRVWIDFNHDGVFSTPDEVVQQRVLTAPAAGTPTASVSGSVNIPATALLGSTRMRVSMKRGSYASACETLPFGEVEDYTVNIVNTLSGDELDNRAASLSFEAMPEKTSVNLYGAYHLAEPVIQIEVEKSLDGSIYEVLETIPGKATIENSQLVQVIDEQPNDGFNFYRMLLLLESGKEVYSPVRVLSYNEPLNYTIFPNPASSEIFIYLAAEAPKEEMQWSINDAYGRVVWTQKIEPDDVFPYRIDVTDFRDGIYYLFAQQTGRRALGKRFVVVK